MKGKMEYIITNWIKYTPPKATPLQQATTSPMPTTYPQYSIQQDYTLYPYSIYHANHDPES